MALNITLTAINSVLSIVTIPLILGFSLQYFMGTERAIPLQTGKVIFTLVIVIIPVVIGMTVRRLLPGLADRLSKPVKIMSALFLASVIALAIYNERGNVGTYMQQVGLAALTFNLVSIAIGTSIAILWTLNPAM